MSLLYKSPDEIWEDQLGQVNNRSAGAHDATWEIITGSSTIFGYSFSPSTRNDVFSVFHVTHSYKMGTVIYPHIHWFNAETTPNTGNVRWGFEYTLAKGHNQQAYNFGSTTTVYVTQACPATRYQHMIAEVAIGDAIPSTNLEPDTVIHMRIFRDAANAEDTCTQKVFANMIDLHYQIGGVGTLTKAAPFKVIG